MTVTFSHHRRSVAARVGVLQVRAAGEGAGAAEEVPGRGGPDAAGPLRGGWAPSWREEGPGEAVVRDGEVAVAAVAAVVAAGAGSRSPAGAVGRSAPFAPSSGTSVTDPVGRAEALGAAPAAPTAV
ncbi:hypothetical protein ACIQVK_08780 [Streptomyces sp. NPDC090493]|uniref:hypothetical protein n=1 Tax=Streptomyces sp. NPDC090493 TaxID=3365964 RepID=UPI00382CBAD4